METIATFQETEILKIVQPTMSAFLPLLEKKRSEIEEIPRSTFKYGSTDRHQLDIYYPITHNGTEKTPVLIWAYGGGFTTGDRQMPPPNDLVYACVGSYFARQGYVTIIPDYRLVPHATFPGAAEDIRDAAVWVIKHPEHLTSPGSPNPDVGNIFLMGHSAGAVHVFTALLLPESPENILRPSVAGAILCAGAYHFRHMTPEDILYPVIVQHWNGYHRIEEDDPMGLLRRADNTTVASLPKMVFVEGENEPQWLLTVGADFRAAVEARIGKRQDWIVAKGHNHISTNIALGTGEGEEWAEDVLLWIKNVSR